LKQRILNLLPWILLAVLGYGFYSAIVQFVRWFASLRSELATAVVAAAATVLVSLLTVIANKFFERRAVVEQEARLKKIPGYEQLIAFLFAVLNQAKPGFTELTTEETIRKYTSITENVIVWGSDSVLKAFGEFRVASIGVKQDLPRLLIALEDVMLAIRKDLGYKNSKILRGDVLRLFINDFAEYQDALRKEERT
jgi:hypothetical protein